MYRYPLFIQVTYRSYYRTYDAIVQPPFRLLLTELNAIGEINATHILPHTYLVVFELVATVQRKLLMYHITVIQTGIVEVKVRVIAKYGF